MAVAPGLFISFEGGEGTGKSVQATLLAERLRRAGADVTLTREPGGTPVGEHIRDVLLHDAAVAIGPEAQALLFSAARAQLVRDIIRPALRRGGCVVADRFFDSTIAYQGYGHRADIDALRTMTRFAVGDLTPRVTFLLDLPVQTALGRLRGRAPAWDRFEGEAEAFHMRVREGYLALARAEPDRFVVVPADRPERDVATDIGERVDRLLQDLRTGPDTIRAGP